MTNEDDMDLDEFHQEVERMLLGFSITRVDEGTPVPEPTKVFRVEMPNGNGPYNSGFDNAREIYETICDPVPGFDCARNARLNKEKMGVTERKFYKAHGEAFYACDSIHSLTDWFPMEARQYLAGYHATVVEYEVPAGVPIAKVGRGEVIFPKSQARKIATHPVTLEGVL